jgi:hypothetical protein
MKLLDLAGDYVKGTLADIDSLTSSAEERAQQIPEVPELVRTVRALRFVVGELTVRLAALELEVKELKEAKR